MSREFLAVVVLLGSLAAWLVLQDQFGGPRVTPTKVHLPQQQATLATVAPQVGAAPAGNETTRPGRPFRHLLLLSDEEEVQRRRFDNAVATLHGEAFFRWLADAADPIPPWRPVQAAPIVCDGREYYSVHFSIPEENIVDVPRAKTRDWATVVPGRKETYLFKEESKYRADLEESRFAITRRRYGFATNRNLEILAAASVPFFCGVERVPRTGTLASLPMEVLRKSVSFPGVRARCFPHKKASGLPIDNAAFNTTQYDALNRKLLEYTRRSMTTQMMALYVLSATDLEVLPRSVLVLWASHYTIALTGIVHGLRRLGIRVEDVPRRPEIYRGPGCEDAREKTYAKGWFFFCRAEESANLTRADIPARIRNREFDVVIISVTDTLTYHMRDPFKDIPHYREILDSYPRRRILTINDADLIRAMQADVAHRFMHNDTVYFKRETHGCREPIW